MKLNEELVQDNYLKTANLREQSKPVHSTMSIYTLSLLLICVTVLCNNLVSLIYDSKTFPLGTLYYPTTQPTCGCMLEIIGLEISWQHFL